MVEPGYVRTDGRLFALTPRGLELGFTYLSSRSLPEVAAPHLEALVHEVGESASVSVLDVVHVARVPTSRIMSVAIAIGTRLPASCTSMGRVLLAARPAAERGPLEPRALTERTISDPATLSRELDAVRDNAFCLVDGELELGLHSIAVPIRDAGGAVVAAADVSTVAGAADLVEVLPARLRRRHRGRPGGRGTLTGVTPLELITRYYDGCTAGDVEEMVETLHPDVVHWFLAPNVGSAPVHGAEHLARYWRKVARLIGARWVVDHCLAGEREAVIEWTMFWLPEGATERIATRGAEWFTIADGLITEIRSYYQQRPHTTELDGFPYADRGWSAPGAECSAVHPAPPGC